MNSEVTNTMLVRLVKSTTTMEGVSEIVKILNGGLSNGQIFPLRTKLIEDLCFGHNGLMKSFSREWMTAELACKICKVLERLLSEDLITFQSLSHSMKVDCLILLLHGLKRFYNENLWEMSTSIFLREDVTKFAAENSTLIERFCDAYLSLCTCTTKVLLPIVSARSIYASFIDHKMSTFLRQPSLDRLRQLWHLINIGFLVIGLVADERLPMLDIISVKLRELFESQELDPYRDKDGQLVIADLTQVPFEKIFALLASLMPNAPSHIISITECQVNFFPKVISKPSILANVSKILMCGLRLPQSPPTESDDKNDRQVAIKAFQVFVKVLDAFGGKATIGELNQMFDVLRVFPERLEHAESRLWAWWHFICHLSSELLDEGFRRFVSPFLANLLGRYLSLSCPRGDPELHRYKLSRGGAYDGNFKALQLCQHVFTCFFPTLSVLVEAKASIPAEAALPCPKLTDTVLVHNSYQLLVALFHWIRLLAAAPHEGRAGSSGAVVATCSPHLPANYPLPDTVDQLWITCTSALLDCSQNVTLSENPVQQPLPRSPTVVSCSPGHDSDRNRLSLAVLQHVTSTTCQLMSPVPLPDRSAPDELHVACPSPSQCLNIAESLVDLVIKHLPTESEQAILLFSICVKCTELCGLWMHRVETGEPSDLSETLHDFFRLVIRLVQQDQRLNCRSSLSHMDTTGDDLLNLVQQLLSALLPDCVQLASDRVLGFTGELDSQDSSCSLFVGQAPSLCFSPDGLRLWTVLADCLTKFISVEQRVCSGDPMVATDFTTIQAALLAPYWLAGRTPPTADCSSYDQLEENSQASDNRPYLSNKDEHALACRMTDLFVLFHQEACLLTSVATNAWIDHLGHRLVRLFLALGPKPDRCLNINLVGRFLRCLAENAECINERFDGKSALDSFSWKSSSQERPFGQLTGLILALKMCLLHISWFDVVPDEQNAITCRLRSAVNSAPRILASPPPAVLSLRSRKTKSTDVLSSQDRTRGHQQSVSDLKSCGLVDTIQSLVTVIRNHANRPDKISCLVYLLLPSLSRLSTVAAIAESAVASAGLDLDEPLVMTQRRQQAKHLLEEVFISIWRAIGLQPFTWSNLDPSVPLLHKLANSSAKTRAVFGARVSGEEAAAPYLGLLAPACGLLRPALVLAGLLVAVKPKQQRPALKSSNAAVEPVTITASPDFLRWLVSFWNALADQCSGWNKSPVVVVGRQDAVDGSTEEKAVYCLIADRQSVCNTALANHVRRILLPVSDDSLSQAEPLANQVQPSRVHRLARANRQSFGNTVPSIGVGPATKEDEDKELTSPKRGTTPSIAAMFTSMGTATPSRSRLSLLRASKTLKEATRSAPSKVTDGRAHDDNISLSPSSVPSRTRNSSGDDRRESPTSDGVSKKRRVASSSIHTNLDRCPIDFEEDAQFVFIAPTEGSGGVKRRRVLTDHQRERFREQRRDYLPTTYTELDLNSQLSLTSVSDSQSESQVSQTQLTSNQPLPEVSYTNQAVGASPGPATQGILATYLQNFSSTSTTMSVESSAVGSPRAIDGTVDEAVITQPEPALNEVMQDVTVRVELIADAKICQDEHGIPIDSDERQCTAESQPDSVIEDDLGDVPTNTANSLTAQEGESPTPNVTVSSFLAQLKKRSPISHQAGLSPDLPTSVGLTSTTTTGVTASPLFAKAGSSRGQRMLAMSLQKVAQQKLAQSCGTPSSTSLPDSGLSGTPTITTPLSDRKAYDEPYSSSAGIMRNFWSKKKPQRVSFADQPMIFTFGNQPTSPPTPPASSQRRVTSRAVLADSGDPGAPMMIACFTGSPILPSGPPADSKDNRPSVSADPPPLPTVSSLSEEDERPVRPTSSEQVDDDADDDSRQQESGHTLGDSPQTPVSWPHRRKSRSPQRRVTPHTSRTLTSLLQRKKQQQKRSHGATTTPDSDAKSGNQQVQQQPVPPFPSTSGDERQGSSVEPDSVEQVIRDCLSRISSRVGDLPPDRRASVLMEALSALKPLMG